MSPSVKDLGALSGDILLFGGPYSNLEASQALFKRADALGIPPENRICTGDVVGYCADPVPTLELVFESTRTIVAGNVERQLAAGSEDCGCGFEDGSACDLLSRGWYPFARARVDATGSWRERLSALPDLVVFEVKGHRIAVIHGGLTDIARFIFPSSPDAAFIEEYAAIEGAVGPVDIVVSGHSGLAFHKPFDQAHWFNAGVIGLPGNNGSPETRFLLISEDGLSIESLAYDHRGAAEKMRAAGLTQGYEAALESGWWPSEDVLPKELRRRPVTGASQAQAT